MIFLFYDICGVKCISSVLSIKYWYTRRLRFGLPPYNTGTIDLLLSVHLPVTSVIPALGQRIFIGSSLDCIKMFVGLIPKQSLTAADNVSSTSELWPLNLPKLSFLAVSALYFKRFLWNLYQT